MLGVVEEKVVEDVISFAEVEVVVHVEVIFPFSVHCDMAGNVQDIFQEVSWGFRASHVLYNAYPILPMSWRLGFILEHLSRVFIPGNVNM